MRCMPSVFRCILAAGLGLAGAAAAQDQTPAYPVKPIRMMVTSSAGGLTDIMTRIMAEQIERTIGQPMIVENRPGAGGNIATDYVAKSAPDGYTLVIINVGTAAITRWITKDMPFDPLNDVVGVAPLVEVPSVVGIYDKLPAATLKEFIAYAKSNPSKINYGSAGSGTMPHLAAELLGHVAGLDMVHVAYKGSQPLVVDLATGRIQLAFLGIGSLRAQLATGKVRAIAVASKQRLAGIPNVPTFEEAGVAGYIVTNWFGVLAPKGTPRGVVQTLNSHIGRIFDNPEVVKRFIAGGMLPMKESPEEFQKRIIADDAKWRDIVRNAGLKPE